MKCTLRALFLALLAASLLTVSALADGGPKKQLAIKVLDPPEETYYLDLLKEGPAPGDGKEHGLDALDQTMLQTMGEAVPAGWHACVLEGDLIFGKLTGDPSGDAMLHQFSYVGVPNVYRILIVTESGETWVSDPYPCTALQASATLDWSAKTVAVPETGAACALQFLSTLLPTLLVEALVLFLFGYRQKRSWLVFLAANLVTQTLLSLYAAHATVEWGPATLSFLLLELLIAIIEGCAYMVLLREKEEWVSLIYSFTANLCSAAAGCLGMELVWKFVVSIT